MTQHPALRPATCLVPRARAIIRTLSACLALGIWVYSTGVGHAMLMRPLGIDELTRKANLIVQGTVQDKTTLRDNEGRIYTKVTVRVSDVWKGVPPTNGTPNSLTIVQSGGTLGDVQEVVSGGVQYDIGEEFVAFLVFNQHGELVTIGLAQGKFHVWRDPLTGEKFASNPFHGIPESSGRGGRLGLDDLEQQVRQVAP